MKLLVSIAVAWSFLATFALPTLADGPLLITEIMADNTRTLADEDGDYPDWIEISNPTATAINLSGWHLTDEADQPLKWTFPSVNVPTGGYVVVFASGKNRTVNPARLHTNFELTAAGEYLALIRPDGQISQQFAPVFPSQVADVSYGLERQTTTLRFVTNGALARWSVPLNALDRPDDWASTNFADGAWASGQTAVGFDLGPAGPGNFNSLIRTDLAAAIRHVNASALLRIPFQVVAEELPPLDRLSLRVNYDDGFIAYLNGVAVAAANAPSVPAWNSAATAEHPDSAAFNMESFDLTAHAGLLQDGLNVLAIQGLNLTAADEDFLLRPELSATSAAAPVDRYFTLATPGAANTGGSLGFVADTKFSVDRGFFETPISLTITTATAGAAIYYTTNGSAPSGVNGFLHTSPILINRTTVIRAIATKPGYTPSDIDTHTYLFLSQVVAQSHLSVTNAGYPNTWAGVAADYAMDTRITGPSAGQMIPSLRSLPSMFISTSISNLFSATGGIYANPTTHGVAWERPASIELVDTNGATEFQENAGLRVQGGYFRDANVTQKHSLRVLFKGLYGAGKLRHDLFRENGAVEEFDGFVLRAGANDGYAWNEARDTEQFTRNQFGGDLHLAMGHSSSHGRFVHLYFNGVYWGQYNLVERPNEDFSSSYFGGDPLEWDSNNAGDVKSGDLNAWNTLTSLAQSATTPAGYQRLLGKHPDGRRNPAYPIYFDPANYIDYMIANIWGGNWDWPNKNFWFGRDRTTNSTGFKFYMWDFENTMGNNRARSPINMVSPRGGTENTWVGTPHFYLKNSLEYRMDFADRVQRYFFNDGLLTVGTLTNRYRALADSVELSIYAETARWGDDNLSVPQDFEDWRRERDWMLGQYLVQRSDVVMQQFRAAGLYPAVGAPFFSSYGGFVSTNAELTITQTNGSGIVYYTTDGSDPRQIGGTLSVSAQLYTAPVSIGGNAIVNARVRVGTNWSALVRGNFTTRAYFKNLAVTEVMYNPPGTPTVPADEFEFVELKNTGLTELNLSGVYFSSGIAFTFANGTRLAAGGFFVLARNPAQFQLRYPGVTVHGTFNGRLDNAGETLRLAHVIGGDLFGVNYGDDVPWPLTGDGFGFSLVPVTLTTNLNSDHPNHWRASASSGGSPGADDPDVTLPSVVISEVLTHTFVGQDFIELHNPTGAPADVSGWFLTDDKAVPQKFRIPNNVSIPANDYLVFTEADFNPTPGVGLSFTLDAESDDAYVFSGNAAGQLTGYSHGFAFGAAPEGVSFGLHLLSTSEEQFPLQSLPSPGQANSGPRLGPVMMSEIHYHPRFGDDAFIEIKNTSATSVPLFDSNPTNTWRINGVDFRFPAGASLPAGSYAIISSSQPTSFRARYNVPASVPVFGPYGGSLQDSGERLELQRPDNRGTNGIAFVTVDEVRYNDRSPWPSAADGIGPSLQRQPILTYGNEPLNWRGASPTPGRDFAGGTAPAITVNPANVTVVATREARFTVAAAGPGPLSYQWRYNSEVLPEAFNSILILTNLQPNQAGSYSAVVYNDAGAVESSAATLTILTPARILQQPADALVRIRPDPNAAPTTNATFVIAAASTSPLTYRWRFNGAPIAGATQPTLTITNVQVANAGLYTAEITDAAGTIFSRDAQLLPLITPVILQNLVVQSVVPGTVVTFSAAVSGSPKPFSFEWRRGSVPLGTNITSASQDFFTFTVTNQAPTNLSYRVIVRNLANPAPGTAGPPVLLNIVADTDGDRMADEWEILHGLNPASAADAGEDRDLDGLSNRAEYEAGTSPTDASSFLKVRLNLESGQALVSFGALSNKTYTIQFAEQAGSGWQGLADVIARSTNRVEAVADPVIGPGRFYRVVSPRQR